jgi:hypothetical protein
MTDCNKNFWGGSMRILFISLALLFVLAQNSRAVDKIVTCEIYSGGKVAFKGKCLYLPEAGGSFSLSNFNEKPLFEAVEIVSVTIVEKGVAEVRGLTSNGNNSRWGEATRSQKDKACWVGADFKICAR